MWSIDNGLLIRFLAAGVIALWQVSISGDGYIEIEYRIDGLIGAMVVPVAVDGFFESTGAPIVKWVCLWNWSIRITSSMAIGWSNLLSVS